MVAVSLKKFFFFKQKTAYEIKECDWSSDVCSSDLSYNDSRGVTRGIHAEPWDKFISVARGSVFGAWVDLREGSATYGKVFTCTLDPSKAIYVPRGVGNSFQALEDGTAYTYLVDAHWSLELKRTYISVYSSDLARRTPLFWAIFRF